MKPFLDMPTMAGIITLMLLAAVCVSSGTTPPLTARPVRLDLGPMPLGDNQIIEIAVINHTDSDVRLRYIYSQCDCTLLVPGSAVAPADSLYILEAELLLADHGPGTIDELITILTDHADLPELTVPVTATITADPASSSSNPVGE